MCAASEVGELVTYVGHNEVNREAKDLLLLCKEVRREGFKFPKVTW